MAHLCEAAVVTCEDFRLHARKHGGNFIAEHFHRLYVDFDLITRGGCIQDLVRPKPGFDDALYRDLNVSVSLHQVKTIYVVGHEDCGAYASFRFPTRPAELAQHHADLKEAKRLIEKRFPGVQAVPLFAELEPGSHDRWVMTEVE